MPFAPSPSYLRLRSRRVNKSLATLCGIALLAVFFYARIDGAPVFSSLRLALFDTYAWRLAHTADLPESEILVVDIDDASISQTGQWPWPRDKLAEILQRASDGGAAVVAFDMVFPEADRLSPASIADAIQDLDEDLSAKVRALPSSDARFAAAIGTVPVVLGLTATDSGGSLPAHPGRFLVRGALGDIAPPAFPNAVGNLPALEASAQGIGVTNVFADPDGVIRRAPLMARLGGTLYPSLSMEALRLKLGVDSIVAYPDGHGGVAALSLGRLKIRTDSIGAVWPVAAHLPLEIIPAHRLLSGDVDEDALRGKVLFVGVSASGASSAANIGRGLQAPGHYLHAMTAAAVLADAAAYRPSHFAPLEIAIAATLALAALILAILGWRRLALGILIGASVAALVASCLAFMQLRALADATFICAVMVVTGLYLAIYIAMSQRFTLFYERSFVGRVVGSMADGLVVSDRNGDIISINPAAMRLLEGHEISALGAAPFAPDLTRHLVEPVAGKSAPALEVDSAWIDDRGQPIRVQVIRDVTKLQEAEVAAALASARLAEAAAGMADGLALFNGDGRLVFCNPAVAAMAHGALPADLAGLAYDDLMAKAFIQPAPNDPAFENFQSKLISLRETGELEDERRTTGGGWVLARERRTQEGGLVCVYIDISELKEAAEALRKAHLTAERASEAKNRLLATVSHELRTPLNAILGFADSMRLELFGPIESPRYREYLQHIMTSGGELLDLVENLLDAASAEQPEFHIDLVPVNLALLAARLEATFGGQYEKAEIEFRTDIAEDMPPCVLDEQAIRRILTNLLANALKYGGSPVQLQIAYDGNTGHKIAVSDAGPGLSADAVSQAFEPFWQGAGHGGQEGSGMGLGLTLVRTLTERQGGRVWIESAPGAGATFHILFPPKAAGEA